MSTKYSDEYIQGVNDVVECIYKIRAAENDGGIPHHALISMFGLSSPSNIFMSFPALDIIGKIRQWEREQVPTFDNAIKILEQAKTYDNETGYRDSISYINQAIDMLKQMQNQTSCNMEVSDGKICK